MYVSCPTYKVKMEKKGTHHMGREPPMSSVSVCALLSILIISIICRLLSFFYSNCINKF